MKKQLSEKQFQECVESMNVGSKTRDIAHGVLVQGKPQSSFVAALGLSKGAVSQAVSRVWTAFVSKNLPKGHVKVTEVVLPEHQAYIVKKWAQDARKRESK